MTDQAAPEPGYTMGYNEEFQQLLRRRAAPTHATHLLERLEPGMRVLDFGCGPGSISVGIAEAVAPGELHGIDMEESQIAMARDAATAGGHGNATFHVGDITDMPFDDGYFDAAHCHAVLMHVPDTAAALAEVRRVLKPGGIIAAREMITDSCFLEPTPPEVHAAWTGFAKLLAANGGHPQLGKELKQALIDAGFADIRATASFDSFGFDEDVAFFQGFIDDWLFQPHIIDAAVQHGLATRAEFDVWRAGIAAWRTHPGAFGVLAFGEAVGVRG